MKIRKILFVFALIIPMVAGVILSSAQQPAGKPGDAQQKITTPPLKMTEEETKQAPEETTAPKVPPAVQKPAAAPATPRPAIAPAAQTAGPGAKPGVPATGAKQDVKFAPAPVKTKTNIELILDASGSMNGIMDSSTKLALLKSVASDILSLPTPEGSKRDVGLRVYGSEKPSEAADCKDTQRLLPIGPLDKQIFKSKLDGIAAQGSSPVGYALEQAEDDFIASPDVDNVIILVIDGADSCNADLCQIATKMHAGPKKIMIHVIGFDLDQKAKDALQCVTKNADGQFLVARGEGELMTSLERVLMANVPYNLLIKVSSGATPLPSRLKVYKSGTNNQIREDDTQGIKFYQLPPGTYNIEVIYSDSKESPQPSKMIKNVEVQATSKAEQTVQFDLGMLTLSSFDPEGAPTPATYMLKKAEDPKVEIKFETGPGPYSLWLTEGTYNAQVEAVSPEGMNLPASVEGLKITPGGTVTQDFRFQLGYLKLAGKNSKGESIPARYKITPQGNAEKIIREGDLPAEGNTINLPQGKYDVYLSLILEGLKDLPPERLEGVEIAGGETVEKVIELPTSKLTLVGKNIKNENVDTTFSIKLSESKEEPAKFKTGKEPVSLTVSPGLYNIKAVYENPDFMTPPTLNWEDIAIAKDQTLVKEAVFKFGKVKLFAKKADGAPVRAAFYIYRATEDEPFATISDITSPTDVELTEGFYNIVAEDSSSKNVPKTKIWFHDVEIKSDTPVSESAVFTQGKLKMICQGPNDIKLECDYRVYTYGTDSPVFEGKTGDTWKEFEIQPGNYYIEAGYHDAKEEVLVKKWIAFKVADNEMVEQVIRF